MNGYDQSRALFAPPLTREQQEENLHVANLVMGFLALMSPEEKQTETFARISKQTASERDTARLALTVKKP